MNDDIEERMLASVYWQIDNYLQLAASALEADRRWDGSHDDFIRLVNRVAERNGLPFRASTWAEWRASHPDLSE